MYRALAAALAGIAQVYGVWMPGNGPRKNDTPPESLRQVCAELYELNDFLEDKKICFLGHSMGALMAYETARQLRERFNTPVVGMIVAACLPPSYKSETRRHTMSDAQLIESLIALGMPREALTLEAFGVQILSRLRRDLRYVETHQHSTRGEQLDCSILAIAGNNDREAKPNAMKFWESFTRNSFTFDCVPGDHFFLQEISHRLKAQLYVYIESLEKL